MQQFWSTLNEDALLYLTEEYTKFIDHSYENVEI